MKLLKPAILGLVLAFEAACAAAFHGVMVCTVQ